MNLTDFHSHILSGVDDGSQSVAESLQMLRRSGQQGVTRIVATPHFYPHRDSCNAFLQRREAAFAALQVAMAQEPDLPRVALGAEVYYFPGISDTEEMGQLTLGGGKYLLVEMPFKEWTPAMYRDLEQLYIKQGLIPVIAHLDRYWRPFTWRKAVRELSQLPVRIQLNSEAFLNPRTAGWAMGMLRKGQVQALGSDCHNLTDRSPDLGLAAERIRAKLGQPVLDALAECADEML